MIRDMSGWVPTLYSRVDSLHGEACSGGSIRYGVQIETLRVDATSLLCRLDIAWPAGGLIKRCGRERIDVNDLLPLRDWRRMLLAPALLCSFLWSLGYGLTGEPAATAPKSTLRTYQQCSVDTQLFIQQADRASEQHCSGLILSYCHQRGIWRLPFNECGRLLLGIEIIANTSQRAGVENGKMKVAVRTLPTS